MADGVLQHVCTPGSSASLVTLIQTGVSLSGEGLRLLVSS